MSDILSAYAALHPDKIAVVDDRRGSGVVTLTYDEIEAAANRLANVLIGLGVMPNTKVVWCGQNSVGVVLIVNAARKIGATAVPLNYRLSDEEAVFVTDHSDAVLVYVDAEFAPMFERIRGELPKVGTYSSTTARTGRDGGVRADCWPRVARVRQSRRRRRRVRR